MRALDDAIKIIDEISFPIDTNDRQQVGCVGGWACKENSLGGNAAGHVVPLSAR